MICVAVSGTTHQEMLANLQEASLHADLVEIRLDSLAAVDLGQVRELVAQSRLPLILTMRSLAQGGLYRGEKSDRLALMRKIASLQPAYLDIEWDLQEAFVESIASEFPAVKLIVSYHDFVGTPSDLDEILNAMKRKSAHWYKIAVMGHSTIDMLRLMAWVSKQENVIAVSMGELGQPSRLIGPVVGCPLTFACLKAEAATAPGQIPAATLKERYRVASLGPHTALYGLIGDPVDKSISDQTHNALMQKLDYDAIYLKMQVKAKELGLFFKYLKHLPFHGLSVTMPLKEPVLSYLDSMDPLLGAIGAANTLLLQGGKVRGANTDGMGALNALEQIQHVGGKHLIVLGAGGAARAIAYEACRRGAVVTVLNRDAAKACALAKQVGCRAGDLKEMGKHAETGYDILINTTPIGMPIAARDVISHSVIMDITTVPQKTLLLQCAQLKNCRVVFGYRMFVEQALGQYELWFERKGREPLMRQFLDGQALEILSKDGA